jgi:hypothetical protein
MKSLRKSIKKALGSLRKSKKDSKRSQMNISDPTDIKFHSQGDYSLRNPAFAAYIDARTQNGGVLPSRETLNKKFFNHVDKKGRIISKQDWDLLFGARRTKKSRRVSRASKRIHRKFGSRRPSRGVHPHRRSRTRRSPTPIPSIMPQWRAPVPPSSPTRTYVPKKLKLAAKAA